MEKIAIWIAAVALIVTIINVVLVFIDLWSRCGKKISCDILKQYYKHNEQTQYSFLILLINHKMSNICITEVSYIVVSNINKPIKKLLFPTINNLNPQLLNGSQAVFLQANFIEANEVFIDGQKPYYIRIKTSKGIYVIDKRKIPFYKKFRWNKTSIHSIEKLVVEQEEEILEKTRNNQSNSNEN